MGSVGLRIVALALLGAAFAAPACAADMAAAPSYYPPAPQPLAVYNWTGIYGGGNIGGGILSDTFAPLPPSTFASTEISPGGLIGGVQAGVNYEFTPWVIGAEVAWTASDITGSRSAGASGVLQSNPQWIGTVTGRIGYAADTLLIYVKGGGAEMHVDYNESGTPGSQSITTNRTGFTVGAGLEYALTENLSAKLEYDFYGFGTKNYPAFSVATTSLGPASVESELNALTVGLNYRFNWTTGPAERCPTC